MSILTDIKNLIANFYLKLELKDIVKEKKPNKFNFKNITTVGILFDATNPEDLELVKKYVLYLKEHRKKVQVVGFFNTKVIPSLTYSKLEYDFFANDELNWFGKPTPAHIHNFVDVEYDLLIDLNIHDHFPLRYISALSKAAFKVGKYSERDTEIYDMMINVDSTQTLKYFMRQIDIYIAMLNKNETK